MRRIWRRMTFELLQDLPGLYVKAKPEVKREILEILLLNCGFDGVTLCPEWNKPFDVIAEGLILESGGADETKVKLLAEAFLDGFHSTGAGLVRRLLYIAA